MEYIKDMKPEIKGKKVARNTETPQNSVVRSFLNGFSSAFDISGRTLISIPDLKSGFQKDREALRGDWQHVGDDMRRAMNIVSHNKNR
jgi:hypothetical protein